MGCFSITQVMVTTSIDERKIAIKCYYGQGGDIRKALKEAKGLLGPTARLKTSSKKKDLMRRWVKLFEETGSVHDQRAKAYARVVPDEVALRCAKELCDYGYSCIGEAALHDTYINSVLLVRAQLWVHWVCVWALHMLHAPCPVPHAHAMLGSGALTCTPANVTPCTHSLSPPP